MFTPKLRHHRARLTLALALVFCPHSLRGESAPLSASVTMPTPAPQASPSDRKDGAGAAAAMAAVGAGIAGMSCAMMMKMAQEAATESERNMYMMMAMQQCAQAAQNAANAAQNGQSKDAATSQPVAAQPQLNTQAAPSPSPTEQTADFKLPESTATETPVAAATFTASPVSETGSGVAPVSAFDGGLKTPEGKDVALPTGPGSTNPNVIPEMRVGYDDTAKNGPAGDVAGAAGTYFGMNSGANSGPAANAAGAKDLNALLSAAGERPAIKKESGDTHGEGAGGEGAAKEGKPGEMDMNAMLAQLMGGGAPAAAPDAVTNGVVNLKEFAKANGAEGDGEELPNIFQYASYRYRTLKKEGGLADKQAKPVASTNLPVFKAPETLAVARGTASLAVAGRKAVVTKGGAKR